MERMVQYGFCGDEKLDFGLVYDNTTHRFGHFRFINLKKFAKHARHCMWISLRRSRILIFPFLTVAFPKRKVGGVLPLGAHYSAGMRFGAMWFILFDTGHAKGCLFFSDSHWRFLSVSCIYANSIAHLSTSRRIPHALHAVWKLSQTI